jgi:glycosyltransferase involved in cell wall biosynthesis
MQLLALVEGADHVCYRYRIEAFGRALAERGFALRAVPLCRGVVGRLEQLRAARRADVVILQRKLLPLWQLWILRRAARCLIYDVDDAVYQRDSYHRKPSASRRRLARFWATVYAADQVIAGNGYLCDRIASYVEPDRVCVIPTCVEPSRYPIACHQRVGGSCRLGWIGQRSTLPSLDRAAQHLEAAAGALPGLSLRVICDRLPRLTGVRIVRRPWSAATEGAELAECDIGINWLPDDPWSRGKCGLKVLQYMAAGLPVVANPVGMNRRMVVHGRTGLLAATPAEWAAAIRRLAADPPLRQRMGAAGRRLVEERFSVARWDARFAAAVAQTVRRAALESALSLKAGPIVRRIAADWPPAACTELPSSECRGHRDLLLDG